MAVVAIVMCANTFAAVTIRYYNKDSLNHKFSVKMNGSNKSVEFGKSRTATKTIQGSDKSAKIMTKCGEITVNDGAKIEIKSGCIKIL
jgi:hypothetical protein